MYKYAGLILLLNCAAFAQTGTFTDKRDGKTYKKVAIGKQVWMAENLNYDVPNVTSDVCYENKPENCVKYGRLYDWKTATKACPAGWHLPTDAEWTTLEDFVGGRSTACKKLMSSKGWGDNVNGTDEYGFSAMPGGYGDSGGYFSDAGDDGIWWSATEYDASRAWNRYMTYNGDDVGRHYYGKAFMLAVRCVQD